MSQIDKLFDRMDDWRHFPDYQLERRADLFFALYLREALEWKLGLSIKEQIVPEFPVHKRTIDDRASGEEPNLGGKDDGNRSYKIDYFALSSDGTRVILVELKTEAKSRTEKQDAYLRRACEAGATELLKGTLAIFGATKAKRKYYSLLAQLGGMGLLYIPVEVKRRMDGDRLRGLSRESLGITTTASGVKECRIVYIQPLETGPESISFKEFAGVVRRHDDPVSIRFAESLIRWSREEAGRRKVGYHREG